MSLRTLNHLLLNTGNLDLVELLLPEHLQQEGLQVFSQAVGSPDDVVDVLSVEVVLNVNVHSVENLLLQVQELFQGLAFKLEENEDFAGDVVGDLAVGSARIRQLHLAYA